MNSLMRYYAYDYLPADPLIVRKLLEGCLVRAAMTKEEN